MGVPVLILGASGSGKSASLRNFEPGEVGIFNVASKPLPFRKKLPVLNQADYARITAGLTKNALRCYVIDDSQYLMAFEAFDKAKEVGYQKFTDMALNFYNMLMAVKTATVWEKLPDGTAKDTGKPTDDVIVYFLHHIDKDENGVVKPKTQGRMLDEKLNVAGLFTTVLLAQTDGKEHWFTTQSDGMSVCKSPMGMFDDVRIPNDLKLVDTTMRAYYGMED